MKREINKIKRERGITLVALVVTIVIIVILSSVTLVATFGENGIIKKAELARDLASNSIAKENEDMNSLMDEYTNIMSGDGEVPEPPKDEIPPTVSIVVGEVTETSIAITVNATDDSGIVASYKYYLNGAEQKIDTVNTYKFEGLTAETEYTIKVEAFDKAGNRGENSTIVSTKIKLPEGVPIPEGFVYVGGTKNDGVVISDNQDDEGKGTSHITAQNLKGNQFVWVPVSDTSNIFIESSATLMGVSTTTDIYSKLRITNGNPFEMTADKPGSTKTSSVREHEVLRDYDTEAKYYNILGYNSTKEMADGFVKEYKDMYESIKKYKGFYIGRYQLTGTVENPTSKAGKVLKQNWYNLKKACINMVNTKYAQSTMIYGYQWDETMNWLKNTKFKGQEYKVDEDSSSWGNYDVQSGGTGIIQPTGSNEKWQANNIYDLAGNGFDITQEAFDDYCRVGRGGYCDESGSIWPASYRERYNTNSDNQMTRPVLYIK